MKVIANAQTINPLFVISSHLVYDSTAPDFVVET
jgi:hypothetical protein